MDPIKAVPPVEAWRQEVNADCIQHLEEALERAKTIPLAGFAIVTVNADRTVGHAYSKTDAHFDLLGAVTFLQHQILTRP